MDPHSPDATGAFDRIDGCQIAPPGSDPPVMDPHSPDLTGAFDRIDDFLAVQGPRLTVDAVTLLQEAVGVDDDGRAVVRDRVAALVAGGHGAAVGSVLLGILVGLFAAESRGGERLLR